MKSIYVLLVIFSFGLGTTKIKNFKLFFISVVLLIAMLPNIIRSQWITQYPYTPGVGLRDIKFINKNTGWICGDGIILKTTNMGLNWIEQTHPAPDKYLYCIHPVDSNIVYCVGWFETILKTTNGGENWFALRNGPVGQGNSFEGTFFINALTGWIGGYRLQVYKTTDGGYTFDSTYIYTDIKDIHFKDLNTGLIVGGGTMVYKTTNQGLDWIMTHDFQSGNGDFRKISVIDNKYCFAVEDGKRVYRSTNYGDTWDSIGYVTGANHPYTCRFSSLQTGWVGGTYGEIFKSTNGGATWNIQYVNINNVGWIKPMYFHNNSIGWVAGGNTTLLFTSTGGATFISHFGNEIPIRFALKQNYPNPFNPITRISFEIPKDGLVLLKIYDILGKEVASLVNEVKTAGYYSIDFDASRLSSGVYFYRLKSGSFNEVKRMVVLK